MRDERSRDTRASQVHRDMGISGRLKRLNFTNSIPLSDEHWVPMAEGEVLAIRHGRLLDPAGSPHVSESETPIGALQSAA